MRIVLCDDHRMFAEPLGTALRSRGHDVVVAETLALGLQAVEESEAEACLLDLRFPEGDALAAVAQLRRRRPGCQVVVLSGSDDPRDMAAASAAGAVAFLRKDQPVTAIFDVLDQLEAGVVPTSPAAPAEGRPPTHRGRVRQLVGTLTDREREVLRHLMVAEDTVKIARSLGVEPSTARTHLENVLAKLGVHNRVQAVTLVMDAGVHLEC